MTDLINQVSAEIQQKIEAFQPTYGDQGSRYSP